MAKAIDYDGIPHFFPSNTTIIQHAYRHKDSEMVSIIIKDGNFSQKDIHFSIEEAAQIGYDYDFRTNDEKKL